MRGGWTEAVQAGHLFEASVMGCVSKRWHICSALHWVIRCLHVKPRLVQNSEQEVVLRGPADAFVTAASALSAFDQRTLSSSESASCSSRRCALLCYVTFS